MILPLLFCRLDLWIPACSKHHSMDIWPRVYHYQSKCWINCQLSIYDLFWNTNVKSRNTILYQTDRYIGTKVAAQMSNGLCSSYFNWCASVGFFSQAAKIFRVYREIQTSYYQLCLIFVSSLQERAQYVSLLTGVSSLWVLKMHKKLPDYYVMM